VVVHITVISVVQRMFIDSTISINTASIILTTVHHTIFFQVSDWWEEYVYLRGRSPIMVNSNFYGLVSFVSEILVVFRTNNAILDIF